MAENQEESVAYLGGEVAGSDAPSNAEVVAGYLEGAPGDSGEVPFVDNASGQRSQAEADTQDLSTQEIVGYLGPEGGDSYDSYGESVPDEYTSVAGTLEGQTSPTQEISGYLEGGSSATQEISGYLESPEPTIQGYLQPPEQVGYLDSGGHDVVDETTNVGDYGQTYSEEYAESSYEGADSYADSYDTGAQVGYDTAPQQEHDTGNYGDGYAGGAGYGDSYGGGADSYTDFEGGDATAAQPSPYETGAGFESYGSNLDSYGDTIGESSTAMDDFDDSLPQTISQQDAESIIKRITTKKFAPVTDVPTIQKPVPVKKGLPIALILGVVGLLGIVGIAALFFLLPGDTEIDDPGDIRSPRRPKLSEAQRLEKKFRDAVLASEAIAFDEDPDSLRDK
ncbi:MAG: hypothetical protein P1V97_22450 [Planctomycetota bacterium]|nr:hypothetical protein [Planctomycetota bacterium]